MEDKSLKLRPREVYGKLLYYPACGDSKLITNLTGRKTFNCNDLKVLRELGYVINMEYDQDE